MNYSLKIREATNKMEQLINKASEEGRDLNDAEKEVFNGLELEVKNLQEAAIRAEKVANIRKNLNAPSGNDDLPPPPNPQNSGSDVQVGKDRSLAKPWNSRGEFLRAVVNAYMPSGKVDNRLMGDMIQNATGMSVQVGSDGGFMVGAENEQWLMDSVRDQSQVFSRITPIPVGADKNGISLPALAETSRADGSRFGGVQAYWVSEAATATAKKPTLRNVDIKLEKLLAFCYMTEELLADTRSLEAFVQRAFGAEMSFKLDDSIIRGDGNGKPLGILNAPALVTVDKETGQEADTIVSQNIMKMWSRLGARYKSNAVWLINQEIEPELSTMTINAGTSGTTVYMPAGGLSGQSYATLYGRPVIACEQCSALGDVGDIILCDLKDYVGIDKGGLAVDSSIHVQFLYDEMAFRFRYRFNGTPYTKSALTPYKGSATTSPYVTLAARA